MNSLSFFYRLRYLMIFFVVMFHAGISYSHLVPWWFVHDGVTDGGFDLLILFFDVFMMPVLFFIAGFFAIPSIERKGSTVFIKDKFKRLGIPFLLGVTFLCPIMPKLKELMLFGALTAAGYFAVIRFLPDRHWVNLFNIVIFQPGRLVFYVAYFVLGAYGYSRKWFFNGNRIRLVPLWSLLFVLSSAGILLTVRGAMAGQSTAGHDKSLN